MIRFLQKDNRVVKIIFIVIIAVAVVTMVITLVPGIFADEATSSDNYATVHSGGLFGRYFGTTTAITTPEVQQVAERILQQKHYPDMVLPYIMPQAAQALIQREVLLQEANRLGLQVGDADLRRAMQTGPFAQALFPGGQFIGEDRYADFVQRYFNTSIQDFETQVKKEIEINRLEAMVTGGITVSDQEVRDLIASREPRSSLTTRCSTPKTCASRSIPPMPSCRHFSNRMRRATRTPCLRPAS